LGVPYTIKPFDAEHWRWQDNRFRDIDDENESFAEYKLQPGAGTFVRFFNADWFRTVDWATPFLPRDRKTIASYFDSDAGLKKLAELIEGTSGGPPSCDKCGRPDSWTVEAAFKNCKPSSFRVNESGNESLAFIYSLECRYVPICISCFPRKRRRMAPDSSYSKVPDR
jgi:hypothetical protein